MRFLSILLPIFLIACTAPEGEQLPVSYAGLALDGDTLSGTPQTLIAEMPVSGDLTYAGEYIASNGSSDGEGTANMMVDFTNGSAFLELSGRWNGVLAGAIEGAEIVDEAGQTGTLTGIFYGSNASSVAGDFSSPLGSGKTLDGTYIVTR